MKSQLYSAIVKECTKRIRRNHARIAQVRRIQSFYERRTGLESKASNSPQPIRWEYDQHCDPFYVRKRAKVIAHAVTKAIHARRYQPAPSYACKLPKPAGGFRSINVSTIPDGALSSLLFHNLEARNKHLLSSYAYAFRHDRGLHHAVEHILHAIQGSPRPYLVQFDFMKYFDMIDHDYLLGVLKNRLNVKTHELYLIETFIKSRYVENRHAVDVNAIKRRTRGIPQGTSVSLFLANVACMELDEQIERTGSRFARYADDTVIVCDSYEQANRCVGLVLSHEKHAKTPVNFKKSEGISILSAEQQGEFRTKSSLTFLGHEICPTGVTLPTRAVHRIKTWISTTIYRHLLLYPRSRGQFKQTRVSLDEGIDWDLVTCINAIRRHIYGSLSERQLSHCLSTHTMKRETPKGMMSFYPSVDCPTVFRRLDGWLVSVLQRALKERQRILENRWGIACSRYSRDELVSGTWYRHALPNETKLPSFYHAWLYVRMVASNRGVGFFAGESGYPS